MVSTDWSPLHLAVIKELQNRLIFVQKLPYFLKCKMTQNIRTKKWNLCIENLQICCHFSNIESNYWSFSLNLSSSCCYSKENKSWGLNSPFALCFLITSSPFAYCQTLFSLHIWKRGANSKTITWKWNGALAIGI